MKSFARLNWLTCFWLVLGYAAAHCFIMIWVVQSFRTAKYSEFVQVNRRGEVLRRQYRPGNLMFVIIDENGKELPFSAQRGVVNGEDVGGRRFKNDIVFQPVLGFTDGTLHSNKWYAVEDNLDDGLYFVAYSHDSRRVTGYMGRNGFSSEIPASNNRFRYSQKNPRTLKDRLVNTNISTTTEPDAAGGYLALSHIIWVAEESTIWKIDLRTNEVKEFLKDNEMRNVGLTFNMFDRRDNYKPYLYVVSGKKLVLFEPGGKELATFPLSVLPDETDLFSIGLLDEDGFFTQAEYRDEVADKITTNISIFEANGSLKRQVSLNSPMPRDSIWESGIMGLLYVPMPIAAIFMAIVNPGVINRFNSTWGMERVHTSSDLMPWILLTTIVGLIVAWIVAQRQLKYFGRTNWFWIIVIGLCGLPGLIAYLFHRSWPSLGKDGRPIPLPAPASAKTSTEIFTAA